ncbi:MAG: MATE family efflux transporter [Alphaproteobacteria bacterium]
MADRDLTRGAVAPTLLKTSAPMTIGVLSVMSIGLADALYLARYSDAALAASGFVFPLTTTIASFGIGMSAGASSVVARAIGAGERARAGRISAHGIGLGFLLGLAVMAALLAFGPLLFRLMGAEGRVAADIDGYVFWWSLSIPPLIASMVVTAILRSYGDTVSSAIILSLIAIINIGVGPFVIFGWAGLPEMGAAGAGLATLIARVAGLIVCLVWVVAITGHVRRACVTWQGVGPSVAAIMAVAVPAAAGNALNPFGMLVVTAAVATVGADAVAGFGTATRIQAFAVVPLLALSAAVGPMVGQNWGAQRQDRSRDTLLSAWACVWAWCLVLGLVFTLAAPELMALAMKTGRAQDFAVAYLRIVGLSLAGYGMTIIVNASLNALGQAWKGMALSFFRAVIVYSGCAWLLVEAHGYGGVLAAAVLANGLAALAAVAAAARAGLVVLVARPKTAEV